MLYSLENQTRGLSGVKDKDFKEDQAMLFFYSQDSIRSFWMPDTYFNLDIIFLDKDFQILYISKNVKAHPGRSEPPAIAVTKKVYCRHVLEVRADSKITKDLKKGDKLKAIWPSP
ncbi:DUF192 domain-containing protein [bacterium]|nr:DUF192 domain-containing protein [bacterium]